MIREFKKIIKALNAELEEPYRFTLDKVVSSANFDTKVLGYANSVLNDWANVPPNLKLKIVTSNTCLRINKWINRRIWMDALNDLLEGRLLYLPTRLVRLNIAINMLLKTTHPLNEEEKEEWREYILDVFYKRCFAISNYYSREIIELPF